MSFQGLSPWTFLIGLGVLLAVLGVLHLLRIRLRRVTVDSLLFFQMLGTVEKPRALPGRPARWLAFLLAALVIAGLWATFAGLSQRSQGPSRVLLVDASGSGRGDGGRLWPHRLQTAAAIADEDGLGPNGAVFAFGAAVHTLLLADEPGALLPTRAAELRPNGPGQGLWPALDAARARLRDGDEIVVIGATPSLPDALGALVVRRIPDPEGSGAIGVGSLSLREYPDRALRVEVIAPGRCSVSLSWDGEVRGEQTVDVPPQGSAVTEFTGLPTTRTEIVLSVGGPDGRRHRMTLPERQPLRVHAGAELPEHVAIALRADPAVTIVAASEAEVVVTGDHEFAPDRPALVITAGTGAAPRSPLVTSACPLALSLRDRQRPAAPALVPLAAETAWVEDAHTGTPLVAARRLGANGPWRVRAVDWLLEPPSHRDVPTLVLGTLRVLAGPAVPVAGAGETLSLPAVGAESLAVAATETSFRVAAVNGGFRVPAENAELRIPGAARTGTVATIETVAPAAGGPGKPPVLAQHSERGPLPLLILLLCVLLVLADAFLYHRGRIP